MHTAIFSFAAGEIRFAGAKQAGVGMNSVCMVNVYSAYNNQAAGAYLERPLEFIMRLCSLDKA